MRGLILNTILVLFMLYDCSGQKRTEQNILYNEDFKWTITIPENFINVSPQEWAKLQNKGMEAIEKTHGEQPEDELKTIFVFKSSKYNYLEANYQPFDVEGDGSYLESCQTANKMIFETFETQMPTTQLDSISSVQEISNLDFYTFKMKIDFPNGITMQSIMYSRLFDKKELNVNIIYIDKEKGIKMIEAWTKSKFE